MVGEIEPTWRDHLVGYRCMTVGALDNLAELKQESAADFEVQPSPQGFRWEPRVDFLSTQVVDKESYWVILMALNGNLVLLIDKGVVDVNYVRNGG